MMDFEREKNSLSICDKHGRPRDGNHYSCTVTVLYSSSNSSSNIDTIICYSASNQVATDVPYESTIYHMHRYF